MNILIISSSQRDQSKSAELARCIQTHIFQPMTDISTSVLDVSRYPCLLDHYGTDRDDGVQLASDKDQILSLLYGCDAVVFVVPEWGGMVPPALVNLLLLCANGSASGLPLGHKPAFAIGVSASAGGSNPITLLKGYAAKNSHLTWLPQHAIVQNVDDFLAEEWPSLTSDRITQVQSRLQTGLESLVIYARQLAVVREELVNLSKRHPYGQ